MLNAGVLGFSDEFAISTLGSSEPKFSIKYLVASVTTTFPRVFELPVSTSPRWIGRGAERHVSPHPRIIKHFGLVAGRAKYLCRFRMQVVIHRNAVAPCISHTTRDPRLFRIHIGTNDRVARWRTDHHFQFRRDAVLFGIRSCQPKSFQLRSG